MKTEFDELENNEKVRKKSPPTNTRGEKDNLRPTRILTSQTHTEI